VTIQASVVQKQASLTEQILVVDLLNRLEPKKDRRRNSSKGIVDFALCIDENAVILTEGRCKVEGVSVLGFSKPHVEASKNESFRSVVASLTENITLNFALETNFNNSNLSSSADLTTTTTTTNGSTNGNQEFSLQRTWAMPLQTSSPSSSTSSDSDSGNGSSSVQSDVVVLAVMERFLIYDVALQQSRTHLQEAFKFLMLGDDAQSKGPKSIAQVRKERESNLSPRSGDSSSGGGGGGDLSYSPKFLHCVDSIEHILGSVQERSRQLSSLGISASCYTLPSNLSDLTRLLNADRKIAVVSVWTCRWHGKIRTGVHFVRNVSPIPVHKEQVVLVSPRSSSSSAISSSSSWNQAEDLLMSLSHPGSVKLPSNRRSVVTQVQVQLWNTGSVPLYVTIAPEGIESTPLLGSSQNGDISSSLASLTVKVTDNNNADSAVVPDYSKRQQGMTWQGKTKYVGLELAPLAKLQVPFSVKFTSIGVFDLQRYAMLSKVWYYYKFII